MKTYHQFREQFLSEAKMTKNQIQNLVDDFEKHTGMVAYYYPKKGVISISGRTRQIDDAIKTMKDALIRKTPKPGQKTRDGKEIRAGMKVYYPYGGYDEPVEYTVSLETYGAMAGMWMADDDPAMEGYASKEKAAAKLAKMNSKKGEWFEPARPETKKILGPFGVKYWGPKV